MPLRVGRNDRDGLAQSLQFLNSIHGAHVGCLLRKARLESGRVVNGVSQGSKVLLSLASRRDGGLRLFRTSSAFTLRFSRLARRSLVLWPARSCDPTAPWPIFTSSCRLASTGLTSISIAFASVRRTTPPRLGGLACHDARKIKLADLHFRINERFLYEYDFGDLWQHQVRIQKRLEIETSRSYPVCVGGQWGGPPEDCGGPQAFLDRRASAPWRVRELLDDLLEDIKARGYRSSRLPPRGAAALARVDHAASL